MNWKQDKTSKFEWTLSDIRMEKIISTQFGPQFFLEVAALLDVRHCKTNKATLRKWQKPYFQTQFGPPKIFFHGIYLYY